IESGLAAMGTRGIYDRFRGRIMFPIYSLTDRIVGFGGRILDGDGAKYLNSPESALFNKRNNLYLMNKSKTQIREKGHVILVEGYMDAIRCHLAGYTNTVASLGTSLTEAQALLIKRMTGLCYICYDSDSAGQEAALRGMYTLQKQGVSVRIVRLTGGKDPDEVLLANGGLQMFAS
ncbi:MAG TPA: DNA primase, partial [Synergistaceae bacterium]|nr:DNA primase [Synergistaceae bacterium]